jgi:hypothetical protein
MHRPRVRMEFYEILDQILALLQRHRRVTYRALKRQFQLDDAYLEDLKAEIIEARELAVDQDGRILVWTGGVGTTPESIHPPLPTASQSIPQEDHLSYHVVSPSATRSAADAERRQLTVLFCDVIDSTVLASELDPEDLRDVVRAYQQNCAEVIRRFDGHIAQYLGDGLLVYFGYPQAHEDDARRAVYTGLEILAAMQRLNIRLERERRVRLGVRLGIHTGLVVIGEMGGSGRQEQLALEEGRPLSWAPSAHAVAGGRPTWQPGSRDSQRPIPWSLVPLPSDWYRDTLPTPSLVCTPSRV